ncbi:helix-turn-helix domain-containing protein [Marinimicrobium alkaliphilum]|uniref:helix-turn-helix domain-containing protein n=1 Tax=Marinimicrobium alkaliphilum TaxID=2202654 RepID=UPI000DB9C6A8|nr:helix-turn-helix domain-containing protein [Marinimicrobium alkaliphilum]
MEYSSTPAAPADGSPELGERLRKVRERAGLSQRELARRAGVPNSSVSNIEQGRVSPSVDMLSRLLAALPMSLAHFFSDSLSGPDFFDLSEANPDTLCGPGIELRQFAPGQDSGECVARWMPSVLVLVLEGELRLSLGQTVRTLSAGQGARLWPGTAYRCLNASAEPARLLLIHPG